MKAAILSFVCVLLATAISAAHADESWPSKPVRLVVPSSPGGGTDVFARLLAQSLSTSLAQRFIVENRPGASGNIGAQLVAMAPPDGYTFLVASNSSIAINLFLYRSPTFDARRDLIPVARGVMSVNVLVASPALGTGTLADFISVAKQKPGTLAYGSAGTGSSPHLGVRMLEEQAGLKFVHVPYKGLGPAYQDLLAGRLQFMYADLASALPYVRGGDFQVLAVDRKTSLLPDAPTFAEAGLPKFDAPISFSVLAPATLPQSIVQRMAAEVAKALKAVAPRLEQLALVPLYDTPAEFAAGLETERANWQAFIERNGITVDQ